MTVLRVVLLLTAGVMVALTPAALASPADPHWLGGLWDDADFDDAVLAVIATVASPAGRPPHDHRDAGVVRAFVRSAEESLRTPPSLASRLPRAPPDA